MGCDIHFYIETKQDGSDIWEYFDWEKKYQDGTYGGGLPRYNWHEMFKDDLYVGRNYDLFAMLANVRNGYGFAGCDTGDGFVPIAMPKGIPTNVSQEVLDAYTLQVVDGDVEDEDYGKCSRRDAERWICYNDSQYLDENKTIINSPDWHSASWFTVQELLEYDLSQVTKKRGTVGKEEFRTFLEKGKPQAWCGDAWGKSIIHLSNAEMEALLDVETEGDRYMTRVEWQESYHDCAPHFWDVTLPKLQKLGNPEGVRIVFWFDN